MQLLNIDFNKTSKLLINGEDYEFNANVSANDHVFNNAGSFLTLKNVYPKKLLNDNKNYNTPFKIPKYSLVELYFGDKLFYFGILKRQGGGTINPVQPKFLTVDVSSLKEFLVHEPMDFSIRNKHPQFVIDKIINKLNIPYVEKGEINFTKDTKIEAYNTKGMSAYDVLRYVEKHTNSTLMINFDAELKVIKISFQSLQSIKNPITGKKGVDITIGDNSFFDKYNVSDIQWTENSNSDNNIIRVESEKSLSNSSRQIEIDLSLNQKNIPMPFPIGGVNYEKTRFVKFDSNSLSGVKEVRKLVITTQAEAENGKPSDISWVEGGTSISLNERLFTQAPNGKIIISYIPLIRQNIDFEDKQDQLRVIGQLRAGSGKLFRYEKRNDLTELSDIISQTKTLLDIGLANKTELLVISKKAIWELGQHSSLIPDDSTEEFAGDYIVKSVSLNMVIGNNFNYSTFKYTLADIKQIENQFNYQDSQIYRDNPLFRSGDFSINVSTTISEKVILKIDEAEITCGTLKKSELDSQLDEELDMSLEYEVQDVQYPVLKV